MSSEDIVRRVQACLKQKCRASTLAIPQEWVEGCVSWYRNIKSGPLDMQALLDFVTEQWFLVDFQQLGLRCLPPNLQRTTLVHLKDSYVLQLLYIVNVGQSAYSQHCKITKGVETNDDVSADRKIPAKWEPRGKRMLLLSLTDGSQAVEAAELVPIAHLHLDLIPGTKVLVKGPVECRRGIMLLRPANIELLGGEVSDLVNCNAPENVLARLIGKAENPNPAYGDYTSRVAATPANDHEDDEEYSQYTQASVVAAPSGRQAQPIDRIQQASSGHSSSAPTWPAAAAPHRSAPASLREKRNLSSPAHPAPPAKKPAQRPPSAVMFPDDDDDDIFLLADIDDDNGDNDGDGGAQADADPDGVATLAAERSPVDAPPIDRPFDYLAGHLERRRCSALPVHRVPHLQTVVIKGFVSTIRGKLEVSGGKWRLSATVNDGSAALDVDISPEVLESLIGYSPGELKSMMTRDANSKQIGQRALDNAKRGLIRLNCLLRIQWPDVAQTADGKPLPTLAGVEDVTRRHLDMLRL